jgi:hypothetical protein
MTDVAVSHLDMIAGIPANYSGRIDHALHAESLNELLRDQLAPVTIIIEYDRDEPERRHASAILLGGRHGIDDTLVLRALDRHAVNGVVVMRPGMMEARFGDGSSVETLSDDVFHLNGILRNDHWVSARARVRPALEFGVFLLRQVCANGAVVQRSLAEGKLMAGCSARQLDAFLDRKIQQALEFPARVLPEAVRRMTNEIPEEFERQQIERLLRRHVGRERAEKLLEGSLSSYDFMNVVTAAAREVGRPEQRRALEIYGGGMLDRYLGASA